MKLSFIIQVVIALFFVCDFAVAKEADLSIGIIQEWSAFNPINSQLASNEALFPFILRKMTRREANGKVLMDIAESNTPLKNKNGKFISIWKIKANAKWGDAKPVTCADWHLGWQTGLNPKVTVDARSTYSKIVSMEAFDTFNLRSHLRRK